MSSFGTESGEFATEVNEIVSRRRRIEDLFYDGKEVIKRADGIEWRKGRVTE